MNRWPDYKDAYDLKTFVNAFGGLPATAHFRHLDIFSDADNVSDYAPESVEFLVARDIIHGYNGSLHLTAATTRAEVAQMLYHQLGLIFK